MISFCEGGFESIVCYAFAGKAIPTEFGFEIERERVC